MIKEINELHIELCLLRTQVKDGKAQLALNKSEAGPKNEPKHEDVSKPTSATSYRKLQFKFGGLKILFVYIVHILFETHFYI